MAEGYKIQVWATFRDKVWAKFRYNILATLTNNGYIYMQGLEPAHATQLISLHVMTYSSERAQLSMSSSQKEQDRFYNSRYQSNVTSLQFLTYRCIGLWQDNLTSIHNILISVTALS